MSKKGNKKDNTITNTITGINTDSNNEIAAAINVDMDTDSSTSVSNGISAGNTVNDKDSNIISCSLDTDDDKKAAIEAVLFAMGDAVEAERLAVAIDEEPSEVIRLLEEMEKEYESGSRGIRLRRLEDSFQLCTKKDYFSVLVKIASTPRKIRLTEALMETLSIIAYKQPVTKMMIEKIRGVSCDHAVNRLLELELITELGRMEAPGRPILLGTSENFLRHFDISSLDELPDVDPVVREDLRLEAQKESMSDPQPQTQPKTQPQTEVPV